MAQQEREAGPSAISIIHGKLPWMAGHAQPWQWQLLPSSVKEAKAIGAKAYFNENPCKHGHLSYRITASNGCGICLALRSSRRTDEQKDKARKANREWRARNLEQERARERQWHHNNLERSRLRASEYNRANAKAVCARVLARGKRVRNATPQWADLAAIRAFYAARPDGHHVDHIVPLNGKNVCGLHVMENLQYLPAIENMKKGNRFDG